MLERKKTRGNEDNPLRVDEESSKLDLLAPDELDKNDIFVSLKKLKVRLSDEISQSPGFLNLINEKDTVSKKELDLVAVMQKKQFECPVVFPEDPQDLVISDMFKKQLNIPTEGNMMVRKRRKTMNEFFDIFKQFYQREGSTQGLASKILEHRITQTFFLILTLYALFAEDYRILVSDKSTDVFYDIFALICFGVFLLEILVSAFIQENYLFTYYFWLDFISTISLILDVRMITSDWTSGGRNSVLSNIPLIGKISRLIRVVRLVRISKIYKSLTTVRKEDKERMELGSKKKESKVGRTMSEIATKTVIITCFILLILLPIFNSDFYLQDTISIDAVCGQLKMIVQDSNFVAVLILKKAYTPASQADIFDGKNPQEFLNYVTNNTLQSFIDQSNKILKIELVKGSFTYYFDADFDKRREDEVKVSECQFLPPASFSDRPLTIAVYQDSVNYSILLAILNIIRTFFVSAIVLGGSFLFGNGIHRLMIQPIERMIEKVSLLIQKPQKIKEESFIKQEEELAKFTDLDIRDTEAEETEDTKKSQQLETDKIEAAINKIGILLGIGFGDAGTNLIKSYLAKEGEGDIMIPGVEIEAIFGFCDIRNFTDVTEVLQEEVMVFVNTIAEIVHTTTDKYLGAANKNIGDAFLLVWKPPEAVTKYMKLTKTNQTNLMTCLADLSLIAFLKIFCEVNRTFKLLKYVNNRQIKDRVGEDYKVRMGFGLHYGWAIEGAIGSYFKVDVSYLSPNVNMAARLEAATKQYEVAILLSGEFYDLLSMSIKQACRKIDIVHVKGSQQALRLYTPDISDRALAFPNSPPYATEQLVTREIYSFKKLICSEILNGTNVGPPLFQNDPEIAVLFCHSDPAFKSFFHTAIESYERGEWRMTRDFLEKALKLSPKDGPSANIYKYIKSHGFAAPKDWTGVRKLTDK